MTRRIWLFLLSILIVFSMCCSASADTLFSITNYSMYIDIQTDGSAYVTETLIYDFNGDYSSLSYPIDAAPGSRILDLNVYLDGAAIDRYDAPTYIEDTYSVTEKKTTDADGNTSVSNEILIYSPGKDDTRLVTYEYRLTNAAERYEDTGMLVYNFISEDNTVRMQNAILTIHFQGAAENSYHTEKNKLMDKVLPFVHGGMDIQNIQIHDNVIEFGPATVSPSSYVEVRLLFPTEYVSGAPLHEARIRENILAEEQRLDSEAAHRAFVLRIAKQIYFMAYTLIFLIVWLCFVRRYHLKGMLRKPSNPERVLNFPAAFVTTVVSEEPDSNAAAGTLLELIQMGHIRMDAGADKKELYFTLLDKPTDRLYPHQKKLIEWLFEDRNSLMLSELIAVNYEQAQLFEKGLSAYCEQVITDMHTHRLKYHNDMPCILTNALIILLGILGCGGILLANQSDVLLGSIMILIMFFLIYLMNRIRRLTDDGELLQADARALIAREVPSSDEMLPFLPYYTALGMTEALMHAVESRRLNSHVCHDPDYLFSGWHHALRTLANTLHTAHNHNASMPRSEGEGTDSTDDIDDN